MQIDWGTLLVAALVLACPVSMMLMMRHPHHTRDRETPDEPTSDPTERLKELEAERLKLQRQVETQREREESAARRRH